MSGGGAGAGRRGGMAAADSVASDPGGSWDYFKSAGGIHIWGRQAPGGAATSLVVNTNPSAVGGHDMLRAYPHVFPRRGSIREMGWFNDGGMAAAAGARIRWMIYSDGGGQGEVTQPANLLFDSGEQPSWPDSGGFPHDQWQQTDVGLQVEPMTCLWMAFFYNSNFRLNSGSLYAWPATQAPPGILGYYYPETIPPGDTQYRIPVNNTGFRIGWRHEQPYGTPPISFPTTTLRPLDAAGNSEPAGVWIERFPLFAFQWVNGRDSTPRVPAWWE